jgi:hypothetical protein
VPLLHFTGLPLELYNAIRFDHVEKKGHIMRYAVTALVIVFAAGCASRDQRPPQSSSQTPDQGALFGLLKDDFRVQWDLRDGQIMGNPLVQKALNDHDLAVDNLDAVYCDPVAAATTKPDGGKDLEGLTIEREKKLNVLKATCVAALRRAERTYKALNRQEEAAKIAALTDRIAAFDDNTRIFNPRFETLLGGRPEYPWD